jgi:Uma2 family endonuclease
LPRGKPFRDNRTVAPTGGRIVITKTGEPFQNVYELLKSLGGIPPSRVLLRPAPGTATEKDLLAYTDRTDRACELVDGTLVEKPMGFAESYVGSEIIRLLGNHLFATGLGIVVGEQAMMRLVPGLVRAPDVSFIRWDKLPGRKIPRERIPELYPDLAVEVLSKSNTKAEMTRKLREYFLVGVSLVWLVDPAHRQVRVYIPTGENTTLDETGVLDGGDVLPGLSIPISPLFANLPDPPAPRKRRAPK